MSREELTTGQLIDGVYAALLGKLEWSSVLGGLCADGSRDKAVLFFHDAGTGSGALSVSNGLEAADGFLYNSYYSKRNPWMTQAAAQPIGLGILCDGMVPRADLVRTEFYNDFMRRIGCETAVGLTMIRDSNCSFMLSMLTETADADVLRPVAQRFSVLAPHLSAAFRHYRKQSTERAQLAIDQSLFASPDIPVIIFGEGRLILAMSDAAAELAEDGRFCGFSSAGTFRFRTTAINDVVDAMSRRDYRGRKSMRFDLGILCATLICMEKERTARFFEGPSVIVILEPKAGGMTRPKVGDTRPRQQ